jgi:hypothetical protein
MRSTGWRGFGWLLTVALGIGGGGCPEGPPVGDDDSVADDDSAGDDDVSGDDDSTGDDDTTAAGPQSVIDGLGKRRSSGG